MPKKSNPRRIPCSRADIERAKQSVTDTVVRRMLLVFLYYLKDKEGYTDERLARSCAMMNRTIEEIAEGRITESDINEVLKDEYGVQILLKEEGK